MHVLYFRLKKLMEPPFSEYLVLLKNRVTFSYSFILFLFSYFYIKNQHVCLFFICRMYKVLKKKQVQKCVRFQINKQNFII
jgi:hypothetical protein